jgi:hypothetical protein
MWLAKLHQRAVLQVDTNVVEEDIVSVFRKYENSRLRMEALYS